MPPQSGVKTLSACSWKSTPGARAATGGTQRALEVLGRRELHHRHAGGRGELVAG